ncbi:6-phospho-beta-glucosidase [Calidifontibacter sp. DB0510]|uniref:6-phospho-beta-glucosidase n=1 Tax=Metallococcus carri TaxID=1656884 RepID=A0A967AX91_9MICO|nr:6-phospho-beta-glucosidase [Metallococcus carri]NHN54674.1 6-phospho-beta-glucosidase [Metallococcus carri]NOP37019.1 6-phospho-beta-glucosidase [Calidifontibacter sp. DB2511S]
MKLTMVGGGGFRTPLVYRALLADPHERRITEVVLHDLSETRLAAIERVLRAMATGRADAPTVSVTTDLDRALDGADFVFSAVRTGGLRARTADERVAVDLGLLGQETVGPGGISYGLRTVPVALDLAERVRRVAPQAWVINFTNPAGLITEAMSAVLPGRVVGICDSPIAMARRAIRLIGATEHTTRIDYLGLNHLGWLRRLEVDGVDRLPELLDDDARLLTMEEGRLFGPEWLRTIGALPNEYLYYYDYAREALEGIRAAERTRGEYLLAQQDSFYASLADPSADALGEWDRVRLERNATYMKEARAEGDERDEEDVQGGGYEGVALALMAAIARDEPAELILNLPAGALITGLDDAAVIEVPCRVTGAGPVPHELPSLTGAPLGLVQQVKAVDRLVIEAATTGSAERAVQAFAVHPLVDSVTVARELLRGYRAAIPELDAVFT